MLACMHSTAYAMQQEARQDARPELTLFGVTLKYSLWIKYLGIYLDAKLSWQEQMSCKIMKASFGVDP